MDIPPPQQNSHAKDKARVILVKMDRSPHGPSQMVGAVGKMLMTIMEGDRLELLIRIVDLEDRVRALEPSKPSD